jgi:hypothetical protein
MQGVELQNFPNALQFNIVIVILELLCLQMKEPKIS